MNYTQIGTLYTDFVNQHESTNVALQDVIKHLIDASKIISLEVNRAGLNDLFGAVGIENIQGEDQMKLDDKANNILIEYLAKSAYCAGIASEESDDYVEFSQSKNAEAQYLVLFDPLDGSGNIDTNASIGTIFNIYKRKSSQSLDLVDFLQPGTEVIGAGYVIYGSSTLLVYSLGNGVHGFTLDPQTQEYALSHFDIKSPYNGTMFSLNYGNCRTFPRYVNQFVEWCSESDKESKRPYSLRYIGSMVADFHRNLIKGGIYLYPSTDKAPNGKLRLLYECIPLSYIQIQAGGMATNDQISIMKIVPTELHQRTPIALGCNQLVESYLSFVFSNS